MIDEQGVRHALEMRLGQLRDELARLTAPPVDGASVSFGKRVGEGTTEAVERLSTTATARSLTSSIADVERALAKLSEGTYGTCDTCEEPITEARLEALPATSRCVRCAALPRDGND
ncbi:MAG: TraR/DksA C4-type zinc finger protein [Acidimicrobiia bacterium]